VATFQEFMRQAAWLNEQNPNLYPLYTAEERLSAEQISALRDSEAGIKTGDAALIQACAAGGVAPERLFFCCGQCAAEQLDSLWGSCRFVAETKWAIQRLDQIAPRHLKPGYLETIALSLRPESGGENFTGRSIPEFSRLIRFSQSLAVRGIFVDCGADDGRSALAKERFSLIKQIRSDMPCLFSYFCLEGLLEPLAAGGDPELLQTLNMLSSLNDTSFYARFYVQ